MNHLITLTDIFTITGLSGSTLDPLIAYAEAQAEAMIGFLHKGAKTQKFYIYDATDILQLDSYPINSVTSITQQVSAGSDVETSETDEYRTIEDQGLIIYDAQISEGTKVVVTYDVGWDRTTVTALLKMLLVILTVNQYYSLNPDLTQHSQAVVSEKIGDYAVKYANMAKGEFKSLDDWAQYLAVLVRKGGTDPEVRSV